MPNSTEENANFSQKKVVGKPFKKGKSGNPNGRPKLTADMVEARRVVNNEIAKAAHMLTLTPDELKSMIDTDNPSILITSLMKAISSSKDFRVISMFLDRILGKARQSIDVKADVTASDDLTEDQRKAIATEYLKSF